jgi:tRNA A-37 threonylcarbamoyl transferase component Bud32/outer membrane protein assembly factor BamB
MSTPESSSARDERVNEVLAEYLEAVEAGCTPDRQAFLAQHAEFAAELSAFFANQDQFAHAAGQLAPPAPRAAEAPTLGPNETPASAPLGTVRYFGDYELLEEIARGGMGVVYKARQVSLNRTVALKMILAGQLANEEDVARFRREAQTAAALQHPNIVAIHEVGEQDGQHYFSMDYVEGQSLADRLLDGPLPPMQAARYVEVAARAIHYAHERGVLHRDLKPGNILLDRDDQPRITDFGLARSINRDQRLTATGAIVGTPSYMPPEQASGRAGQVGPASDTYSLGAVLYELVTGRPPFQAATPLDTLLQVLETEPAAPRLLNRGISRDLETVILKCLHKDPARRYASAQDLADDLGALREGRPVKARRPSLPERVGLWLQRQGRTFKLTAAAVAVAALALLVVFLILNARQQAQRGWVEIDTPGPALRAEVFAEDGTTLVVPPFTVPAQQPLPLPEGSYRVRLSAPYLLSERFQLSVQRGKTEIYAADLSKRQLIDPLPSTGVFEFLPRGKGQGLLNAVSRDTLSRYDGTTGKLLWSVTLGLDDRPVNPGRAGSLGLPAVAPADGPDDRPVDPERNGGARPPDDDGRSSFFDTTQARIYLWGTKELRPQEAPRLLQPCHDLDGDGIPDLVWLSPTQVHRSIWTGPGALLLALSGKDGKLLWRFHAKLRYWSGRPEAVWLETRGKADPPLILTILGGQAEAVDARTGRSVWRSPLGEKEWHGPWLMEVDGHSVLVCVAGRRLIGLEPRTGKPAWDPVDLGFVPVATPAFADLDGDGRIDMVLCTDAHTVRAVAVPAGKVLWNQMYLAHKDVIKVGIKEGLKEVGWVPTFGGSGYLLDPLLIDLDGDGKAEVIVPDERGTIAVLDGSTGEVRWRNTVAINRGSPSAARVLVGPDLDGDGCRDLFTANDVCELSSPDPGRRPKPGAPPRFSDLRFPDPTAGSVPSSLGWPHLIAGKEYARRDFHPLVRVQALSGKTGQALWRCHFPITGLRLREMGMGEPLLLWERGPHGWTTLVVPGNPFTFLVEAHTGQLAHLIPGVPGPYRTIDLDGKGIPTLIGYQLGRPGGGGGSFVPPRLHLFRDTDLEAGNPWRRVENRALDGMPVMRLEDALKGAKKVAADTDLMAGGRPVTPQEEPVEWVPLPWVGIMSPESEVQDTAGLDQTAGLLGPFEDSLVRGVVSYVRGVLRAIEAWVRILLLVPALLFLSYVGLCLLRKGWSGLRLPVSAYLVSLVVLLALFLGSRRGTLEPWQRYSWDGWYWILYMALAFAVIVTPCCWLGTLLFFRRFRRRIPDEIATARRI